jgi:hypothetical protein
LLFTAAASSARKRETANREPSPVTDLHALEKKREVWITRPALTTIASFLRNRRFDRGHAQVAYE